jgi:hypothetical protein
MEIVIDSSILTVCLDGVIANLLPRLRRTVYLLVLRDSETGNETISKSSGLNSHNVTYLTSRDPERGAGGGGIK